MDKQEIIIYRDVNLVFKIPSEIKVVVYDYADGTKEIIEGTLVESSAGKSFIRLIINKGS